MYFSGPVSQFFWGFLFLFLMDITFRYFSSAVERFLGPALLLSSICPMPSDFFKDTVHTMLRNAKFELWESPS